MVPNKIIVVKTILRPRGKISIIAPSRFIVKTIFATTCLHKSREESVAQTARPVSSAKLKIMFIFVSSARWKEYLHLS